MKNVPTDYLYTIDVVCHGTPSPKLLKEYIKWQETSKSMEVVSVAMREKGHPKPFFSNTYTKVTFSDGTSYQQPADRDYYGRFFGGKISNRPICYQCPFKSIGRMSDITVGDCWFSRSLSRRKDVPFDVTLCLVHSEKGEHLLKSSDLHCIQVDAEKAIRCNGGMIYSCNAPHPKREGFFQRLGKDDFGILAEEYFPVHAKKKNLKWKLKQAIKLIPGVHEKYYFSEKKKEFENRCRRAVPESARVINEIKICGRSNNNGVQDE